MDPLRDLLADHVAAGVERQNRLAEVIGDAGWSVDVPGQRLEFDHGVTYPVDLVGSAAEDRGSWMWAWANSSLAPEVRAASEQLRQTGAARSVAALTERIVPLGEPPDGIDGHAIGLLATPLLGGQAYYLARNGPLALVLVVHDPALELPPLTGPDLRATLSSVLGLYGIPAERALRPYLAQRGAALSEQGPRWDVATPDGQHTIISWDNLGRVTGWEATLGAPPAAESGRRRLWRR